MNIAPGYDVVVVGAGNAAFCAAHAARERGATVVMLEKTTRDHVGGNSYFTAGATRTTYDGLPDLRPLVDNVSDEMAAITDLPAYSPDQFRQDMLRVTDGRCDPELTDLLVSEIDGTVRWLHSKGMHYRLMYDRQAFLVDGRYRFWGGLALGNSNGGQGLIADHLTIAARTGIELRFEAPVVALQGEAASGITGVIIAASGGQETIKAGAVVLACGGFEANAELRQRYLGPGWEQARVRGTAANTGDGLMLALAAGAQPYGDWAGCHAIQWDAAAPLTGDWTLTNLLSKQSYPIGLIVNRLGQRFVDEGADFRNYTYARYGAEILKQPAALAFQLYDAKTRPLLRHDEYTAPLLSRTEAATIPELARALGIDPASLDKTIRAFNAAVQPGEFNPAIKDGKCTQGIDPPKSNWAQPLDRPPFVAFAVTCGITFTFGGLRIDRAARVLDRQGQPIPGLLAAGELVGGLFYGNYPGGSGLSSGAVFGRRAGYTAAEQAQRRH